MNYSKSAVPYLLLLIVLVIGVPFANHQAQKKQHIKIEIKNKPVVQNQAPIALKY